MPRPPINWQMILEGVNDHLSEKDMNIRVNGSCYTIPQGTHFETEREMWQALYVDAPHGFGPLESILGVAGFTIRNHFMKIGIPLKPHGWPVNGTEKKLLALRDKIKDMTCREACERYGFNEHSFYALCNKFKLEYRRVRKNA